MTAWVQTFHIYPQSRTFEDYFRLSLTGGQGFRVLLHAPFCLRQLVAKREDTGTIDVSVLLPSGASYILIRTDSTNEYTLNTAQIGTSWHPLAKESAFLFSYGGEDVGVVEVALTLRPAPETVPWA